MPTVRIFTPAYNVGSTIGNLVREMNDVRVMLARDNISLEMLIINDNSSDDTGAIVDALAKVHSFLAVQNNDTNMGNGHNIKLGYEWAQGADIAGCLDADGEHSPYAMIRHLRLILSGEYDGVAGSIIFPDHNANHHDRNMMRYFGGVQAALAGVDGMFYIQSPGYNLHRIEHVIEMLQLLRQYEVFFADNSREAFPRWGMHGVIIHLLSVCTGERIKAVYLECFGQSPNRSPDKLTLQANAAQTHINMLQKFCATLP